MKTLTNSALTLVAAVSALVSCNKMPSADIRSSVPDEIVFTDGGIHVDTKAFTEATGSTLQANGFNVAAIVESFTTMFNKTVTYNDGTYSVAGEHYYYPAEGLMDFFAVYPTTQDITIEDGEASLSYIQNADTDLIAARKYNVSGSSEPVTLAFEHLLSQVSVNVIGKEKEVDYEVDRISLKTASGGTYSFAEGCWIPESTTADVSICNFSEISTGTYTTVGQPVSVIPGAAKLNVAWSCYHKDTFVYWNDITLNVNLPQGKHTTLNLSLPFGGDGLKLNTTVGNWTPEIQDMEIAPKTVNGIFTVDDDGKRVKFAKGNLYWNGIQFRCEENQYDYPSERNAEHVGHFFWSKTATVAYASSYSDTGTSGSDIFFAADGGVFDGFTVLSNTEWDYLFANALAKNSSSKITISIDGKNCLVLKPDGFSGTVADSYSASDWAEAESAFGLVALPFAGEFFNSRSFDVGTYGKYWSATPDDAVYVWKAFFRANSSGTDYSDDTRDYARSVRLVSVQ